MKLSEAVPWTDEVGRGFTISAFLSSILFSGLIWLSGVGVPPIPCALFMFVGLILANVSPIKHQSAIAQCRWWLALVVVGLMVTSLLDVKLPGEAILAALIAGGCLFTALRVVWWGCWDVPNRMSIVQRILVSTSLTALLPLGALVGLVRLLEDAAGRYAIAHQPAQRPEPISSTEQPDVSPDAQPKDDNVTADIQINALVVATAQENFWTRNKVHLLPGHPALSAHARRMATIRAAQAGVGTGRLPAENKDAASKSL